MYITCVYNIGRGTGGRFNRNAHTRVYYNSGVRVERYYIYYIYAFKIAAYKIIMCVFRAVYPENRTVVVAVWFFFFFFINECCV